MQKLDIDFQRPVVKAHSMGRALLVLAILAALSQFLMQRDLNDRIAVMDAAQSNMREKPAVAGKQEGDPALQAAFNQLTLPWDLVFASVEDAANDEVLLLALEGDGRNRTVRISAQVLHVTAMLDYLERLKNNGKLKGWRLLSHREDDKGALRFVIQAELPEGI